jgi:DNA invertase Pin-like site-specific DNA recombinase
MGTPKHAIAYCRISDARNGDAKGVDDQEADIRALADRLGWGIGRVVVENDTSAFQRRKVTLPDGSRALRVIRPGWRAMLDDLAQGRADGVLAYDLDRACRDPRDLEDLVDVVESTTPRIPVESVTGSLKLANDADVTMARVMVAVGNKSSRDTGRRVARARLRQATDGQYGGGRRAYGFESDGVTVRPAEAAEIIRWADAVNSGVSLRQVVADLRARQVPTAATAAAWTPRTVRGILLRPRNAGIAVYRGEEVGQAGEAGWPAILDESGYRAVVSRLTDPARRSTPGNTPRWLGSLIYRCGVDGCGGVMYVSTSGGRRNPSYRCREKAHLTRHR